MDKIEPNPIAVEELNSLAGNHGPILFVYINAEPIGWRLGYVEGESRTDLQIYARVSRYWQVQRFLPEWSLAPASAPKILVAVALSPDNRIVIASMKIRLNAEGKWDYTSNDLWNEKRMIIPVDLGCQENNGLDYLGLRGRRVLRECNLIFGNTPSQEFRIHD